LSPATILTRSVPAAIVLCAGLCLAAPAGRIEREWDGYFHTGDGIRARSIAFVNIKIYRISHEMRELPPDDLSPVRTRRRC
jgi:hypothetical protein